MRLAYADPPYPGKAHLDPENTEVDHAELIAELCEYDGWALSTDERSLQYVLALCPPGLRVLAWCKRNVPPLSPNPIAAWEPVIAKPARTRPISVRSYCETPVDVGFRQRDKLPGQKSAGFCEWVLRCIGAEPDDSVDDLFPGTGIMGETWDRFRSQPPLFVYAERLPSGVALANRRRRQNAQIEGLEQERDKNERSSPAPRA